MPGPQPQKILAFIRSLVPRQGDELVAHRQAERLAAVAEAQRTLALTEDDEELITNQIAEMARRLVGADGASYELVGVDRLTVRGVSGSLGAFIGTEVPLDGSLSGIAAREQRTVRCDDVRTDARVHWPAARPGWLSKLATPLHVGRQTVGVISVMSQQPAGFREDDEHALELLAESLGAVLQRRQDQERLRDSEQQYRSLFADNPQPMCVFEPETLRILAVNSAGVAQYGYTEAEFLGLCLWDLTPQEDRQQWREQLSAAPMSGTRHHRGRHRRKNGEAFEVEAFGNDILYQGRRARVVLASDVTEQRRAQQEIARLNADLEERVRQRTAQLEAANAELEAFSYSIAHDLRSPLTSIDGFSRVLEESYEAQLDDKGRHYLQRIQAAVLQMSELTDAMLSLAHLSRVKLKDEPVDLAEAARSVIAQLREREPQRVYELDAPHRLWVRGDPRLLHQVIANLVGNAWKFSAKAQRTHIRVGAEVQADGSTVYLVADQGAGFDMTHAWRLFGAFQRLHAPSDFDGTGIGLALVQKIVARHGGRIWAQSAPGQGATFYVTLAGAPTD
jgi:PAS domain S-box-containing protein